METREYWVNQVASLKSEIARLTAQDRVQKQLIKSLQDENYFLKLSHPPTHFAPKITGPRMAVCS